MYSEESSIVDNKKLFSMSQYFKQNFFMFWSGLQNSVVVMYSEESSSSSHSDAFLI